MKHMTAITVFALTIAFVVSPAFTSPFSGFRADQLPVPQIDPPIQPAGYAFAIWGVIYAWLVGSALFGIAARSTDADWNRARFPLAISLAVGVPWLAIANASAIWATVTIIIMAIAAVAAVIAAPLRDRWWFQAPVGLYAGWLTAASWVSIGTTMAGYGVLSDSYGWAFIGIAAAFIVAAAVFLRRPSAPEYLIAVIWALIGIIVANGMDQPWVTATAATGATLLIVLAIRRGAIFPAS